MYLTPEILASAKKSKQMDPSLEHEDPPLVAKLRSLLNRNTRIEITDGRLFVGQFMCIDHSKNIILAGAYESRPHGTATGTEAEAQETTGAARLAPDVGSNKKSDEGKRHSLCFFFPPQGTKGNGSIFDAKRKIVLTCVVSFFFFVCRPPLRGPGHDPGPPHRQGRNGLQPPARLRLADTRAQIRRRVPARETMRIPHRRHQKHGRAFSGGGQQIRHRKKGLSFIGSAQKNPPPYHSSAGSVHSQLPRVCRGDSSQRSKRPRSTFSVAGFTAPGPDAFGRDILEPDPCT